MRSLPLSPSACIFSTLLIVSAVLEGSRAHEQHIIGVPDQVGGKEQETDSDNLCDLMLMCRFVSRLFCLVQFVQDPGALGTRQLECEGSGQ